MPITEQRVGDGWFRFQSRKGSVSVNLAVLDPDTGEEAMIEVPRAILIRTLREALEVLESD